MTRAERIYLDHLAGSPLRPTAREAMQRVLSDSLTANPGSAHREGQAADAALEAARDDLAATLGARPRELVFTSGATEALRIAIEGRAAALGRPARIVSSVFSSPAVRDPLTRLARRGAQVTLVPGDASGQIDVAAFVDHARDADIVVVPLADRETAALHPYANIVAALDGPTTVVDASLGPGRVPCDVAALGASLIAWSSPMWGGPEGGGLLYVSRGTRLESPSKAGSTQESLRGGRYPLSIAVGMATSLVPALVDGSHASSLRAWIRALMDGLQAEFMCRAVVEPERALPRRGGALRRTDSRRSGDDGVRSRRNIDRNGQPMRARGTHARAELARHGDDVARCNGDHSNQRG